MPFEVLMRFGKWQEILDEPEPAEIYPIARALRHVARGVAYNALGKMTEAEAEHRSFRTAAAACPKDAFFGNNPASLIFTVAENLLEGERLMKAGKKDAAIAALKKAVEAEDQFRYDEPPDWFYPTRHALGAALLLADKPAEAQKVYTEDLKRWPENGWSLYGLSRSYAAQGKATEATKADARFRQAWKSSDFRLSSSCLCLTARKSTR